MVRMIWARDTQRSRRNSPHNSTLQTKAVDGEDKLSIVDVYHCHRAGESRTWHCKSSTGGRCHVERFVFSAKPFLMHSIQPSAMVAEGVVYITFCLEDGRMSS